MRTVALFGFGPSTRDLIHQVPHDTEIWSVNWAYIKLQSSGVQTFWNCCLKT